MIKKNELEIGGQSSLAIGNLDGSGVPLLPNLGIHARWGVSDWINTGGTIYPLYLLANYSFGIELFVAMALQEQHGRIPGLNVYTICPVFTNFREGGFYAVPGIGMSFTYEKLSWGPYAAFETMVDSDIEGQFGELHSNVKLGISHKTKRGNWLTYEIGLNNIGIKSFITNNAKGFPLFQLGFSCPIILKESK